MKIIFIFYGTLPHSTTMPFRGLFSEITGFSVAVAEPVLKIRLKACVIPLKTCDIKAIRNCRLPESDLVGFIPPPFFNIMISCLLIPHGMPCLTARQAK
jgi:hypothetical protein